MPTSAPDLSPREARDRYLDKRRVDASESTISSYHYRLKLFVEWCEDHDIESMAHLSGWDIDSYEAHRRGGAIARTSLNNELTTLKNWLEYCARIEVVDEDLPEKVDVPDLTADEETRETTFDAHEARRLIDHYRSSDQCASRGHVLLELAWFTAARVGGIRALDVRDLRETPEGPYLHFTHRPETGTPLKNGADGERPVGIDQDLATILDEYVDSSRIEVSDDHGRQPLITGQRGRPTPGTLRDWMYLATQPCHYGPCPHDKDPATCDWRVQTTASHCPSSRSPHPVRGGAITWMRDREVPIETVSKRVNASVEVIKQHYDTADSLSEMDRRRRPHLDKLGFDHDHSDQ